MSKLETLLEKIKQQVSIYAKRVGDINLAIKDEDESFIKSQIQNASVNILLDSRLYKVWGNDTVQLNISGYNISKIKETIHTTVTRVNLPYTYDKNTLFIIPILSDVEVEVIEYGANYFDAICPETREVEFLIGGIVTDIESSDIDTSALVEVIPYELEDAVINLVIYKWFSACGDFEIAKAYYAEYERVMQKRKFSRHIPTATRKYRMI